MKRSLFAAGLFASLACYSLTAQSGNLLVNVPFDFLVGKVSMPAGEYTISQAHQVVTLRNTTGHLSGVIVLTNGEYRPNDQAEGKLVFNRYGNEYYLSNIWTPNNPLGRVFPKSPREKELMSRLGAHQPATIALKR